MNGDNAPENCPECGAVIVEKSGTSSKTGKPYHFWSCSAYPDCKYTWNPPTKADKTHEEVMEALRKIYSKLLEIEKK